MKDAFKPLAAAVLALSSLACLAGPVVDAAPAAARRGPAVEIAYVAPQAAWGGRWANCSGADHPAVRTHGVCPVADPAVQGRAVRPSHPAATGQAS